MRQHWTTQEIVFLKEHYKYGASYCAKILNKKYNAVVSKAYILNLKVEVFNEKYTENNLRRVLSTAKSFREAFALLQIKPIANQYRLLRERAKKYNIDISHFEIQKSIGKRSEIPLDEILNGLHPTYNRTLLKKRLYEAGLKKRKCELCGQDEMWHGKKISLILDHINGIRDDNRLSNLQIVCPNCNAALDTFAGKNRLKKEKKRILNNVNKQKNINKQLSIISLILNSDIDFSKLGWVSKTASIIGCKPQKVNSWMKKYMLEFYNVYCFKRKACQS